MLKTVKDAVLNRAIIAVVMALGGYIAAEYPKLHGIACEQYPPQLENL